MSATIKSSVPLPGRQHGLLLKVRSHMPVPCRHCSPVMETLYLPLWAVPYLQPELGYLRAGLLTHGLRLALLLHLGSLFKRMMFCRSLKKKKKKESEMERPAKAKCQRGEQWGMWNCLFDKWLVLAPERTVNNHPVQYSLVPSASLQWLWRRGKSKE